ncbi:MAG: flagellar hook-associated protein FlgK [Clostridium sp.]|uniref:flagellar hook-associated protein FlgK n=1 Tax=Clostridium sp. TaxID=1506 RepID=UPI0025BC62DE|nr:flagellar hook-associated protein FlgK [Clostridium sp.]MCE5220778.1 flagellar hook-associated protein FlgK [Clostridium sp.]
MSGLFDTFTIAKRGLNVQQGAINTTSHNIANANTEGYSRQRAVAEATKPFGGMSRFDTCSVGQVGTGAEITSIQRIRDYFIDYQVRNETGTSGYYTQTSETLSKVEDIFGEPSDTGIQELTNQFFNAFQEVSKSPDKTDVKTVAIKDASALADAINYTYNQLEKTCEDSQSLLQTNVTDVNSYLDQINELNKQIRSVSAVGQTANDLMDKRDNLLDKLSNEFGIKVDRDSLDTINLSSTEYPDAALVKSDPNDTDYSRLSYVKSAVGKADGTVEVEYYLLGNENSTPKTFTITAADANEAKSLAESLLQNRVLIADKDGNAMGMTKTSVTDQTPAPSLGTNTVTTGSGATAVTTTTTVTVVTNADSSKTYTTLVKSVPPTTAEELVGGTFQTYQDESQSTIKSGENDVDNNHIRGAIAANQKVQEITKGYMDKLDRLAAGLAYSVNAIQVGSTGTANTNLSSSDLIFVTYDDTTKTNLTTDKGITAKTIRINDNLLTTPNLLNCNTKSTSGEGDGKRANAIANLNSIKMNLSKVESTEDLTTMDRATFLSEAGITGFSDSTTCLELKAGTDGSTVDSYYKSIINNLATTNQEASRQVDNQEAILSNLEDQKNSVSGVSLDEEMTNLIQYQHAYQANAKMISTIDELLDVVINGLKR